MRYALDANIVSYYLKGNRAIIERIAGETDEGNSIVIPPTVFYEIIRWLLTVGSTKRLAFFEAMCSLSGIGTIDRDVLEIAAGLFSDLQRKGITVGDNDILISAYCIRHGLIIVTNNEKHFRHIPGLAMVNWL